MNHVDTIILSTLLHTYHIICLPHWRRSPMVLYSTESSELWTVLAQSRCSINMSWVQWTLLVLLPDHILFTPVLFLGIPLCAFDSSSPTPLTNIQSTALGLPELSPHAEDLSAWAFTSPLGSPQPMTDWYGRMGAQLTCPRVLSSVPVSKEPNPRLWVIERTRYKISHKLKSFLKMFEIIKKSTTFRLVLLKTVTDGYLPPESMVQWITWDILERAQLQK